MLTRALNRFGAWLGTPAGFWATMAVTAACMALAVVSVTLSTFGLSVVAIILPSIILLRDHLAKGVAEERDKALHAKLDELVRAIPQADDALRGIEPQGCP